MSTSPSPAPSQEELRALVTRMRAELAAKSTELAAKDAKLAQVTGERDKLRRAYERLLEEVELLRRRIYVAKAERVDSSQLELALEETKKQLDKLAAELQLSPPPPGDPAPDSEPVGKRPAGKQRGESRSKPKGRRNLAQIEMPESRVEVPARCSRAKRSVSAGT